MYPLLVASILALAAILERWMSLRFNRVINVENLVMVEDMIRTGKSKDALDFVKDDQTVMARIVHVGLLHSDRSPAELKAAIEDSGRLIISDLQKNLALINTLGVVSPLMGLLGTVLGMIQVFNSVMDDRGIDMQALGLGIHEALFTTVSGLVVAVPCVIMYNFYWRKIEILTNELEKNSLTLMNLLTRFGMNTGEEEDAL